MVSEIYTTYDYSFYCNQDYNVNRQPTSYRDVSYQRIQDNVFKNTNSNQFINMGNINRDKNGEQYYDFVYSPMLSKTTNTTNSSQHLQVNPILYYIKKLFCCGE